jgi:hypothetical protein
MISETEYNRARAELLANNCHDLLALERRTAREVLRVLHARGGDIRHDFDEAVSLLPFWASYAPLQRGRRKTGRRVDSYPWSEVGEKSVEGILYAHFGRLPETRYPGIPFGHDVRFLTDSAFVHIDAKSSGPKVEAGELDANANQLSGGGEWENGRIRNKKATVRGDRSVGWFRPELPPFYIIGGKTYPCLTHFVKIRYDNKKLGHQPLVYIELVTVPNGLALFGRPRNPWLRGLMTPGKKERGETKPGVRKRPRVRVQLAPLAAIDAWRCIKLSYTQSGHELVYRSGGSALAFLDEPD